MSAARTGYSAGLLLLVCVGLSSSLQLTDEWIISQFKQLADREAAQDQLIANLQDELWRQESMAIQRQTELEGQIADLNQELRQSNQGYSMLKNQHSDLQNQHSALQKQVEALMQQIPKQAEQDYQKHTDVDHANLTMDNLSNGNHGKASHPEQAERADVETTSFKSSQTELATDNMLVRASRLLLDDEFDNDEPIAFHAVVNKSVLAAQSNSGVVFETVLLNSGNAYHSDHGLFIAPTPGLYMISVTLAIQATGSSDHLEAYLMRNHDIIGTVQVFGDFHRDQSSTTLITALAADDEVWVKTLCCTGENYNGEKLSAFSGILLFSNVI